MSTVNFGVVVSETALRYKQTLLTGAASIADVDFRNNSRRKLERGDSFVLTPTRLFACSINGVKILIRITVSGQTVELPISSTFLLPIEEGTTVEIEIENPSDNTMTLPAIIDYITV